MENKEIIKSEDEFKKLIYANYMTQIKNFFGDEPTALKFLSGIMSSIQKNPKLKECSAQSVIQSFMTMAQLQLMPSDVSGEAYVLPYKVKNEMVAQFQLGYQGLITLFFRAGVQSIRAEIVRKNDTFSYINGKIHHEIDIFKSNEERGEAVGAYAIAIFNGQEFTKVMNKKDILLIGERFSKSWKSDFTPWREKQDPELWMWKKTTLKQLGKTLPKNESIFKAISIDNEADSRLEKVDQLVEKSNLQMKKFLKEPEAQQNEVAKTTDSKKKKKPVEDPNLETIVLDSGSETEGGQSEGQ